MKVFVMLMWLGSANGGPAVIDNFSSLNKCEIAAINVKSFYDRYSLTIIGNAFRYACVEVEK